MKKRIKLLLGLLIVAAVLIFVILVFIGAQRGSNLETGTLQDWRAASLERRAAAVQILAATTDNNELLVACVDKMATLPDSASMEITTAVSLCNTGLQLKESL